MTFYRSVSKCALLGLLALLTSCTDVLYVPSAQNVPLHKEKGELKFSAGKSITEETIGWNLRSSYSFTDHLAGIASYSSLENDGNTVIGEGSTWRAGLGYYTPLNTTKLVFETYGGFGGGEGYLNRSSSGFISYRASEVFMQQAFGYSGDYTFVGVSMKTSRLAYHNIKSAPNGEQYPLDKNRLHYFIEPAFTMRLGYKVGYLELQIVHSYILSASNFPMDDTSLNLGLHLNLGPVIKHIINVNTYPAQR